MFRMRIRRTARRTARRVARRTAFRFALAEEDAARVEGTMGRPLDILTDQEARGRVAESQWVAMVPDPTWRR